MDESQNNPKNTGFGYTPPSGSGGGNPAPASSPSTPPGGGGGGGTNPPPASSPSTPPSGGGGGFGGSANPVYTKSNYQKIIEKADAARNARNIDGTPKLLSEYELPTNQENQVEAGNLIELVQEARELTEDLKSIDEIKKVTQNVKALRKAKSIHSLWWPLGGLVILGAVICYLWFTLSSLPTTGQGQIDQPTNNSSTSPDSTNTSSAAPNASSSAEFEDVNANQSAGTSKTSSNSQESDLQTIVTSLIILDAVLILTLLIYILILQNREKHALKALGIVVDGSKTRDDRLTQAEEITPKSERLISLRKQVNPELPVKGKSWDEMLKSLNDARETFKGQRSRYDEDRKKKEHEKDARLRKLEEDFRTIYEPEPRFMIRKVEHSNRSHPYGEDVYKITYGGMDFEICSQGVLFDYDEMSKILGSDDDNVRKFKSKTLKENSGLFSAESNPYLENFRILIDQLKKRDGELQENLEKIDEVIPRLSAKMGYEGARQALERLIRLFDDHETILNRDLQFIEGGPTPSATVGFGTGGYSATTGTPPSQTTTNPPPGTSSGPGFSTDVGGSGISGQQG